MVAVLTTETVSLVKFKFCSFQVFRCYKHNRWQNSNYFLAWRWITKDCFKLCSEYELSALANQKASNQKEHFTSNRTHYHRKHLINKIKLLTETSYSCNNPFTQYVPIVCHYASLHIHTSDQKLKNHQK